MFRILVIKLGALGDIIQAFAPFAAIRTHWPSAEIVLLTTASFQDLAEASPFFDRVLIDERVRWIDLRGVMALRRLIRGYDLVIDLQTSGRSTRYFFLAGQKRWSGIAGRGLHLHDNPCRDSMHSVARQRDQLARLGIPDYPQPDLAWLARGGPSLPQPYVVLVPGAAPHRPAKRWPASAYGALADILVVRGFHVVIAGAAADKPLAQSIRAVCPLAQDMTGQTDFFGLGSLFARASLAVGNDTGPMHLAAAMGCRALVLFSGQSNPRLTAPIGRRPGQVTVLAVPDLSKLGVSRVAACLDWGH